eukprot:3934422-Rhodomonas_salina.3
MRAQYQVERAGCVGGVEWRQPVDFAAATILHLRSFRSYAAVRSAAKVPFCVIARAGRSGVW